MAETLSVTSVILFIIAAIFVVVAIVLWFVFKIPNVVGDLSGRNARKSIKQMRLTNENTSVKRKSNSLNANSLAFKTSIYSGMNMNETGLLVDNVQRKITFSAETESLDGSGNDEFESNDNILNKSDVVSKDEVMKRVGFVLLEEILFIHTDEVIR